MLLVHVALVGEGSDSEAEKNFLTLQIPATLSFFMPTGLLDLHLQGQRGFPHSSSPGEVSPVV